jgi:6-phosphogluconolactonase
MRSMRMNIPEKGVVFHSHQELSIEAAKFVIKTAQKSIVQRGRFTVAISGGSAAKLLLRGLCELSAEVRDRDKWYFFWADERCVPLTDSRSNYNLAKTEFFDFIDIPEQNIYPVEDSLSPHAAATAYQAAIESFFNTAAGEIPVFDLILLGLGEDGHTASLFPGRDEIEEKQRLVVSVKHSPKPPPERVTFTLPLINNARNVLFITAGSGKTKILERLNELETPHPSLPASMVQPKEGAPKWLVIL